MDIALKGLEIPNEKNIRRTKKRKNEKEKKESKKGGREMEKEEESRYVERREKQGSRMRWKNLESGSVCGEISL